jgi:hypothetical protein
MAGLTEYKEEYIDEVDNYLNQCGEEEDIFHKTRGDNTNGFERVWKVDLPKIEGFAYYLGVHKDTIYKWEKENPKFSDALEKIRLKQHNMLVDGALSGRYNSTISKLMLSSNHGYKEKSETDNNHIVLMPSDVLNKLHGAKS